MSRIVYDRRVVEFVEERIGGQVHGPCTAVGMERNGKIVAGAIFERCNGRNVFFHGASDGSRRWATRELLRAVCAHAFHTLGVERMTTVVAASNVRALAFDRKFGFREEARLARAAHDGSDAIYLVMWRAECKWLHSTS